MCLKICKMKHENHSVCTTSSLQCFEQLSAYYLKHRLVFRKGLLISPPGAWYPQRFSQLIHSICIQYAEYSDQRQPQIQNICEYYCHCWFNTVKEQVSERKKKSSSSSISICLFGSKTQKEVLVKSVNTLTCARTHTHCSIAFGMLAVPPCTW